MEIMVVKEFTFDSAHFLPFHEGKCKNVHGHTYKLQIGITAEPNENGIVMDFGDLKKVITKIIIEEMDHQFLNSKETENGFPAKSPTAENMVKWIVETVKVFAKETLSFVRLYETPTSYAEWRKGK